MKRVDANERTDRDDTHYRIEGDGIAVLRPETLADCPTFRAAIDAAAMAEGGEHG